jgi:hypothetical protein
LVEAASEAVDVEPTRVWRAADAKRFCRERSWPARSRLAQVDRRIMSAFIRARNQA